MLSDNNIIDCFKNGQREKAFAQLYHLYPRIEKSILSRGGSKADAKDVFQEALIIFYRNIKKANFELNASIYTYLYAVSKYVWKDLKKQFKKNELQELKGNDLESFHSVLEEKKYQKAEEAFTQMGKRCKQILQLFYLDKLSFQKIASILQFSSEKVAKNEKYKCLKKAKALYTTLAKS